MRAAPVLIAWHNESQPIWSAHFEIGGKGRLATAGGDNNVRLWKVESNSEERVVTFLATLSKHTQAVNVVRWCPHRELLASAGDDGNVLLWTPIDVPGMSVALGEDHSDDKETWHVKRMCRSTTGSEIYDLAWSPDGNFFITGSMDNVARIFDAQTGNIVRQIAEHNHYVQGVAWDPLNEFLATQSSDRSVHIYKLRTKDGQFSLDQHSRMTKMDLPPRRRTSSSPAPPEMGHHHRASVTSESSFAGGMSPQHSVPDTPNSQPHLPASNAPLSHSRRSSFGNAPSPAIRRSASPAPSLPLPAVMPSASPRLPPLGVKNTSIYASEALTSFFRRLTFAPDGSLLFTPAGQYKTSHPAAGESGKQTEEIINTVYIYTRGGLNKPPVAHLPGHKKPSIAVRCSPLFYNHRLPVATKAVTVDTSATGSDPLSTLPEPVLLPKAPTSNAPMEPPASVPIASPSGVAASPKGASSDSESQGPPGNGPQPAFSLPYRIVYAVATQDTIYIYDTQQQTPLCVVSNLHLTTFTDVAWSNDGSTLLIASSDGFCSTISFSAGELGTIYTDTLHSRSHHPTAINTTTSTASTPSQTPTGFSAPGFTRQPSSAGLPPVSTGIAPSPSPVSIMRPPSPTRSNSASSVGTQSSFARPPPSHGQGSSNNETVVNNPAPTVSAVPGVTAGSSAPFVSPTPPMTPSSHHSAAAGAPLSFGAEASEFGAQPPSRRTSHEKAQVIPLKRGSESEASVTGEEDKTATKKRRVAPTPVTSSSSTSEIPIPLPTRKPSGDDTAEDKG